MIARRSWLPLESWFPSALAASAEHSERHAAGHVAAAALVGRLLLVHRTGKGGPIEAVFAAGQLTPADATHPIERAAVRDPAVWCYLGCGAYPEGKIALLFTRSGGGDTSHAPVDTGGLARGRMRGPTGAELSEGAVGAWLADLRGESDFLPFAGAWLAAHFTSPTDYVTMPRTGDLAVPPLHGLHAAEIPRLAWSVEVRMHHPVPLAGLLRRIVVARRADAARIPPAYLAQTITSPADADLDDEAFYDLIARR